MTPGCQARSRGDAVLARRVRARRGARVIVAAGGSRSITAALCSYLGSLGGRVETGRRIGSMADLPRARAHLFDVTPRQLLAIAGDRLPASYRARLARYRYGPGAFKIDYALSAPIPWRSMECARACTVHLGGTTDDYVGGDINGGIQDAGQLFTRPVARAVPYSTPAQDIFLCSSSTPPGGGVHGMCGLWAARAALARLRGERGYAALD